MTIHEMLMHRPERDRVTRLYLSGELVPAGTYHDVATGEAVVVESGGALPAHPDGGILCFAAAAGAPARPLVPARRSGDAGRDWISIG